MSAVSARERLERSRQILLRQVQGPASSKPRSARQALRAVPPAEPLHANPPQHAHDEPPARPQPARRGRSGFLSTARDVAGMWWHHHPAHTALAIVEPTLGAYGRARPFSLLGSAAGIGAAVVILRAWRFLPLTGIAIATLRSSQITSLAASLVAAGAATLSFSENHDENEREELHPQ